jgi:hypothetical protein
MDFFQFFDFQNLGFLVTDIYGFLLILGFVPYFFYCRNGNKKLGYYIRLLWIFPDPWICATVVGD